MKVTDSFLNKAISEAKKTISVFPNFNWREAVLESDLWRHLTYKQKNLVFKELSNKNG